MIPSLVIDALATARLTRLITRDSITEPLRDEWVMEAYERAGREAPEFGTVFDEDPPMAATFITCPWCVSVWVGVGVVAARRFAPALWGPIARALALSQVAGMSAVLDEG